MHIDCSTVRGLHCLSGLIRTQKLHEHSSNSDLSVSAIHQSSALHDDIQYLRTWARERESEREGGVTLIAVSECVCKVGLQDTHAGTRLIPRNYGISTRIAGMGGRIPICISDLAVSEILVRFFNSSTEPNRNFFAYRFIFT